MQGQEVVKDKKGRFKSDKNLSLKLTIVATNETTISKSRGKDKVVLYNNDYETNLKANIYGIKNKIE